jgi:fucose permease
MFSLSRWSGGLFDRMGARIPLIAGPLIAAVGFALFALPGAGGSYWTTFFPAMVVLGLGMAATVAPLTTTVMSSVETRHAGAASGINNAVSRTAGLLAVAALSVVMLNVFERRLDDGLRAEVSNPAIRSSIQAQATRLAAIPIPREASPHDRESAKTAIDSAFLAGFRRVMLIGSALAILASATAAWLIRRVSAS